MMTKEEHEIISMGINNGYLAEDLEPIKCHKCNSENLKEVIKAIDGGHVSEKECECGECGQSLGYWAYGHWQV
jgi:hypothetical protein